MKNAIKTIQKQEQPWFQIYKRDCKKAFGCKKPKQKKSNETNEN